MRLRLLILALGLASTSLAVGCLYPEHTRGGEHRRDSRPEREREHERGREHERERERGR
jgi:hypothetical protein